MAMLANLLLMHFLLATANVAEICTLMLIASKGVELSIPAE